MGHTTLQVLRRIKTNGNSYRTDLAEKEDKLLSEEMLS